MKAIHELEVCLCCGVPILEGRREIHHIVPAALGGTVTIPLCTSCHDAVDRMNFTDLDWGWFFAVMLQGTKEMRIIILKAVSLGAWLQKRRDDMIEADAASSKDN